MNKPLLNELFDSLFDATGSDKLIALRYVLGCMFVPPHGQTRAVFLHDKGGAGKSTLLAVFKKIFPKEIHTEIELHHLEVNGSDNTANSARAQLINKCIAFVSDAVDYVMPLAVKKYITGDLGAVSYRSLFKDSATMTNQAMLFMVGNKIPKIKEDYAAFCRRLIVVNTKGRDKSKPPIINMDERILATEKDAFIRLLIESIIEFKGYDFMFPCERVDAAIGRFVPKAQEIMADTIEQLQIATGLNETIVKIQYSPGLVLPVKDYVDSYMASLTDKLSPKNKYKEEGSILNFIEEMLGEQSNYWDSCSPEKFDRTKLPEFYPKGEKLYPFIFVKDAEGLRFIVNASLRKDVPNSGMSTPGAMYRRMPVTQAKPLTTFLDDVHIGAASSIPYQYVSAIPDKMNTYDLLNALKYLGQKIKEKQNSVAFQAQAAVNSNIKSINSAPSHKKVIRPLLKRKTVEQLDKPDILPLAVTADERKTGVQDIIDFDV